MKIRALKKLYRPVILPVGTICAFFYGIAASDSHNIHKFVSFSLLSFGVISMTVEVLKDQEKSYKEAIKRLREKQDSSSPIWDGVVRSVKDLEPRMRMLENRILKDAHELQSIKFELEQHDD